MKNTAIRAAACCFIFALPVLAEEGVSASSSTGSAFREMDRLFIQSSDLEAGIVKKCVEGKARLVGRSKKRLDNLDKDVEKNLGACPVPPVKFPAQIEAVVCDRKLPFIKTVKALVDAGQKDRAVRYYSCLAIAGGAEGACDPVKYIHSHTPPCKPGHEPPPMDASCRGFLHQFQMAQALIAGDPSAEKTCRSICAQEGVGLIFGTDDPLRGNTRSCETVCALAAKYRSEPARFCAEALPAVGNAALAVKACRENGFSILAGLGPCQRDPLGICAPGEPCTAYVNDRCFDYAAYRKAYEAKDKTLCGDSGFCAAAMGSEPRACEAYAEDARGKVCDEKQRASKRAEWERQRDAMTREKRAQISDQLARANAECAGKLARMKTLDEKIGAALLQIHEDAPGRARRDKKLAAAIRRHQELGEKAAPAPLPQ